MADEPMHQPLTIEAAAESLLATPPQEEGGELKEADEAREAEAVTEETKAEEDADTDETEGDAEAEEEVETEDGDDDDADDADDVAEDEDGEEAEAEDEEPDTLYTVKVDGVEQQVTLAELTQSFSGQAHIQKQMQTAAEARKQAEATFGELQTQRDALSRLAAEMQAVGMTPPQAPDPALFDQDPIGYMDKKMQFDRDAAEYNQRIAGYRHVMEQQAAAEQNARAKYVQEQADQLKVMIPEFADPEKRVVRQQAISRVAQDHYGFTEAEVNGVLDARMVSVLDDARKWQELQASKAEVVQKAKKKAKPPVKAKAKRKADPKAQVRQKQRASLKKSGSVEDAVDLIFNG